MLRWPGRAEEVSKRINNEIKKEHQLRAREDNKIRKSIIDKLIPFRTRQEYELNKYLIAKIRREKHLRDKPIKILLLGSSRSGKSTIAKQLRVIHSSGFSEGEFKGYISIVHSNVIEVVKILVTAANEMEFQLLTSNKDLATKILSGVDECDLYKHSNDIASLWADPAIQQAFLMGHEFGLDGNVPYFLNDLDRIGSPDYLPSQQDIIYSRQKTFGILEHNFELDGINYKMVDPGGLRSERKKWLHLFQEINAVFFVSSLSDYNLKMMEDNSTNRMHESLELFAEVCNNDYLNETIIFLFLNKQDVFKEMIERVSLKVCFDDYDGPGGYQDGLKFITNKFIKLNTNPKRNLYANVVNALDTESVSTVFKSVKDSILRNALLGVSIL